MKKMVLSFCMLLFSLCFIGCVQKQTQQETKQKTNWEIDIDYLQKELAKKHVNLFFKMDENEFNSRLDTLKTKISDMNEDEIRIELQKIIADVGDEHTTMAIPAKEMVPIEIEYYVDGWYIINTTSNYKQVMNCKIVKINGYDMKELTDAVSEVISHSNQAWLKARMKYYLPIVSVLRGLGFVGEDKTISISYIDHEGGIHEIKMNPIEGEEFFNHVVGQEEDESEAPLYKQKSRKNYWYAYLPDNKCIYFKYNVCQEMEDQSCEQFTQELLQTIDNQEVDKFVIDLRDNCGGDSGLLDNFINELSKSKINEKDKLYVIIGRNTFSSAVLNAISLKYKTKALFVGEPTGGSPIHYGEVQSFKLPESKATIKYSTKYFDKYLDGKSLVPVNETGDSLIPDHVIELTMDDYRNHLDPVMDYILKQ